MKDKTRKITLIVLICIAMIGSFLTLTVFSFVKSSDAFTESFNGSIERAYEQSDKSQSLEELKETSEKGTGGQGTIRRYLDQQERFL